MPGGREEGLRVLFMADRLSARGGADRHLLGIVKRLRGEAHTLLAVGHDDGSLPEAERAELGAWRRVKGLERGGLRARGGAAARRRLGELLDSWRPRVVHLQNIMDPALLELSAADGRALLTVQDHRFFCPGLGKLTARGEVCRRVMGEHCLGCFEEPDYGRRLLELTRRRLAAAAGMTRVLVLSQYMAEELERAWAALGIPAPPLSVLPPWVDGLEMEPEGLRPPGECGYHLLAGRLVERKGVRVALEAARRLERPLPLWVAGDGPLAGEVARAAQASGGRVRFLGWQDRGGMARLLAGARSLWLPSLWAEPFGLVGLEALWLGRPVVASAVGGVGQWLRPGENGFVVPPGDAPALAAAADRLAVEPALADGLGQRGRRDAAAFAPAGLMARLWGYYRGVALAAPSPAGGKRITPLD